MKEISIESKEIDEERIMIEFFLGNDFQMLRIPTFIFEKWIVDNKYLEWHHHRKNIDNTWDEVEGQVTFEKFMQDNLTDEILEKFLISEMKKMKS